MPTTAVRVFGPNLRGNTETFHVHAAECQDCRNYGRGAKLGGDGGTVERFSSVEEVVSEVYADMIGERDETETWEAYLGEFRFFPCVDLPRTAEERGEWEAAQDEAMTLGPTPADG